jgi:hypothetical protein
MYLQGSGYDNACENQSMFRDQQDDQSTGRISMQNAQHCSLTGLILSRG